MARDYSVGTVLIRRETKRDRWLRVERIDSHSLTIQHEDGHRERLSPRLDIPIANALFGYRVATEAEARAWSHTVI